MKRVATALYAMGMALALPATTLAQDAAPADVESVSAAVEQLRHVVGEWDVTTTFYKPDGTPGRAFEGTYAFEWVLKDTIVKGMSAIPAFDTASGLLFYLRGSTQEIEMVSVGADGQLWTMTGPQVSETRVTPLVDMPDGTTLKLRFTRFNVSEDRFESKMERSADGGETWVQGNHQLFRRKTAAASSDLVDSIPGEQVLRQALVVDADLDTAWAYFTAKDRIESWMAPVAEVDLSNGGSIRSNYDPCANIGDPGTIELRILSMIPRRMLTLHAVLPDDPRPEWMNETVFAARARLSNVIEFEALPDGRTQITSWGLGYGTGPEWEQMIAFFTRGNEWSFGQLQKAVGGERATPVCGQGAGD